MALPWPYMPLIDQWAVHLLSHVKRVYNGHLSTLKQASDA